MMSKTMNSVIKQGGYKVLGTMEDGVKILMPHTKPTHFTMAEARSIMRSVRRAGKPAGYQRGGSTKSAETNKA
jgi:hypothetical protein